MIKGVVGKS